MRTAQCGCAVCKRRFAGLAAFDKHFIGIAFKDRRCRTDEELRSVNMFLDDHNVWNAGIDGLPPALDKLVNHKENISTETLSNAHEVVLDNMF